jgi:hypothetical protein
VKKEIIVPDPDVLTEEAIQQIFEEMHANYSFKEMRVVRSPNNPKILNVLTGKIIIGEWHIDSHSWKGPFFWLYF